MLFLPEEVRLCAIVPDTNKYNNNNNNNNEIASNSAAHSSGLSVDVSTSAVLADSASAATAAESDADGIDSTENARTMQPSPAPLLLPPSQPPQPPQQTPRMTPLAARKALAAVQGMQLVRVGTGLKAWPEMDVYPGANAWVLKPSSGMGGMATGFGGGLGGSSSTVNWSLCRAICLANGFGGFAVTKSVDMCVLKPICSMRTNSEEVREVNDLQIAFSFFFKSSACDFDIFLMYFYHFVECRCAMALLIFERRLLTF